MADASPQTSRTTRPGWRVWLRRAFVAWAIFSTAYVANTFRTRNVPATLLASDANLEVIDSEESLCFQPKTSRKAGLVFLCGAGVAARAYAPLLRPLAKDGFVVVIVKLPYRLAPLESHKLEAIARTRRVIESRPDVKGWVVSGHSLGGALACRVVQQPAGKIRGLALVGTTHPKADDLSMLSIPITKVYGSEDGVAPSSKVERNRDLLPTHTKWVLLDGANHSQFGHYGHQLLDGRATIERAAQQTATRAEIHSLLTQIEEAVSSETKEMGGRAQP